VDALRAGLRELGWVEGQNLDLEIAWVNGRLERLPEAAAELVRHKPDVIFAPGEQGLAAAKQAAGETPIVTVACDPLDRLIASLAAPGGSATGLSCVHSELAGKRLEILKEFVSELARAGVLYNERDPNKGLEFQQLESTGARLGIAVRGFAVTDARGIEDAFADMAAVQAQAVMVLVDAFTIFHRQRIVDLALEQRLPSIFGFKEFVEAGGLVSYGASRGALFARAASYVDKILKGAKPGELPVEEPAIFELYINRKTATALGLTIPPTLLVRADEVIE
jgi:putative ABC transport system substrate-binding protein